MAEIYHSINEIARKNLTKQNRAFLEKKYGINKMTMDAFNVGFIRGEIDFENLSFEDKLKSGFYSEDKLKCYIYGYYTFPITYNNKIVGFWTRAADDKKTKTLYLKNELEYNNKIIKTYNKSDIPFNSPDSLIENNKILVLSEGAGDVMAIAQNLRCKAIAYGTSQIPDKYIPFIVSEAKKVTNVIIWADNDDAGQNGGRKSFFKLLEKNIFSNLIYNNHYNGKDPADYFKTRGVANV